MSPSQRPLVISIGLDASGQIPEHRRMNAAISTLADDLIVLEPFVAADGPALVAGEDEEQARRFGWWPARSTPASVAAAIAAWQADEQLGRSRRARAIHLVKDHALVGGCEVRLVGDAVAELSYWVFPAYRGQAIAARAVHLLAPWAAAEFGIKTFRLEIEPDNVPSRRVAAADGFVAAGQRVGDTGAVMLLFERTEPPLLPGHRSDLPKIAG